MAILLSAKYFGIEKLIEAADEHIVTITDGQMPTQVVFSYINHCNYINYCAMLSDAVSYSEDDTVNTPLDIISRYYASTNTWVRKAIMKRIAPSIKIKFQEL